MSNQPRDPKSTLSGNYRSARDRLLAAIPLREQRRQLAGIPTVVLEGGDGPPIVLIHGPGEFAAVWMRVIPDLAATHHVVVPDLPGHGESGLGAGPIDTASICAWLRNLIDQTCDSPPIVVGHLLGGAIALRLAIESPASVSRVVLVDSYGLSPFRPAAKFALAMLGFMVRPNERTQERAFRGCFMDLDGLREEVREQWQPIADYALDQARRPANRLVMRSLMPKLGMPAIPPEQLSRIKVPTTLIWGRHDRQVRLRVAEAASARHGWPLHVIEGAADDPAYEQPVAFLKALRAHLPARSAVELEPSFVDHRAQLRLA